MDNILNEVSMSDYHKWSTKLSNGVILHEDWVEFCTESESWNLYDVTYQKIDKEGKIRLMRKYGIPTPYLQSYLKEYFSPKIDFSQNGISNLTVTPHNMEFRSKKLNDGTNQGEYERTPKIQRTHLEDWKKMSNSY